MNNYDWDSWKKSIELKTMKLKKARRLAIIERNKNKSQNEILRIPGYLNNYSLRKIDNKLVVFIKYEETNNFTKDGVFDNLQKAMEYIHECLAYEMSISK